MGSVLYSVDGLFYVDCQMLNRPCIPPRGRGVESSSYVAGFGLLVFCGGPWTFDQCTEEGITEEEEEVWLRGVA